MLDAELCSVDETDFLIAPIVGLQMAVPRLHLPHGMQAVRADAIEAPVEAMRSEGMGRQAWEPQFLAIAEKGEGAESAEEAMRQLHELITVMRLFKGGGVGLGPYAFAPTGEGAWRRIATGAGAVRPGGYLLSKSEAESLAEFACALEVRPDPEGALAWAVDRFEMGRGRDSALEGLSDHLLALRSMLGGEGPVGASLPKRAAALIEDDPVARGVCHERIEAAIDLERSLMRGAPPAGTPELAGWVEEGVRENPPPGRARRDQHRPRHRRRRVADRPRAGRGRRRDHRLRLITPASGAPAYARPPRHARTRSRGHARALILRRPRPTPIAI